MENDTRDPVEIRIKLDESNGSGPGNEHEIPEMEGMGIRKFISAHDCRPTTALRQHIREGRAASSTSCFCHL